MYDRINKKNMNMNFNNVKTMWKMMQINLPKFWKKTMNSIYLVS